MVLQINYEPGRTFSEFSLLPGHTKKDCMMQHVSLDTELAGLHLKIPLVSAAMTSVTGYEMALALGKAGGLGILPARLDIDEQASIIGRIKHHQMGFVAPHRLYDTTSLEKVVRDVEIHGHSKIPIIDINNVFQGLFTLQHYWESPARMDDPVTAVMLTEASDHLPVCRNSALSEEEARSEIQQMGSDYLIILDSQDRLQKIAFKKDFESIPVGAAISTYEGWQRRARAYIDAGVDMIVIDTSDGDNDFVADVLHAYKRMSTEVPICAGNIVTYDGARFLMEEGADVVKIGMSAGSICITQRQKAVGRAPMTALIEADHARHDYYRDTGRYVPLIIDGGVACSADMVIAFTIADAVMLGNYLNRFYESQGEKFDEAHNLTRLEEDMQWVATWGEGSERAKNLDRYGHASRQTFFAEGVEGVVPYMGKLKPNLKKDLIKVRAALSNAGCRNLAELRKNATIELISPSSQAIVSKAHDVVEHRSWKNK